MATDIAIVHVKGAIEAAEKMNVILTRTWDDVADPVQELRDLNKVVLANMNAAEKAGAGVTFSTAMRTATDLSETISKPGREWRESAQTGVVNLLAQLKEVLKADAQQSRTWLYIAGAIAAVSLYLIVR